LLEAPTIDIFHYCFSSAVSKINYKGQAGVTNPGNRQLKETVVQRNRVKTLHHSKQTLEQKWTFTIVTRKPCSTPAKMSHQFISLYSLSGPSVSAATGWKV